MTRTEGSSDSGLRIGLLAGQAFALGLMMAWILVPASAIFLDAYGSGLLPVTYIGAAIAGAAASAVLASAFRRRPLPSVAATVLVGLCLTLLASWVLLWRWGAAWVSFGLLVLVPIVVPVGFMFVVGQAGMLLDVRALKALYARVIAGFACGFVAGGLAGPPLLAIFGHTEHLLAAAAVAAGLFFGLVTATRRTFPAELSVVEHGDVQSTPPTLREVLRNRYITLIVGFQTLSAVESQWLDYLVFDRAAQRYYDSRELARFVSQFTAITYGADILFLLAVAGLLLRRFGLRYGLTANPAGVLAVVGTVIVAASLRGSGATVVFVLIVAARVTDLVLSDGAARASLSAAYQAVPNRVRFVAQATVEGLAVPMAIGLSGLVLLVVRATTGTNGVVLPLLTSIVVLVWAVVAVAVYRGYRVNLVAGLRHRQLDLAELTIDDASDLVVIDRLIDSDNERDVRLGLDTLTVAEHPALPVRLGRLAADGRASVRIDALERLVRLDATMAATAARDDLDHPSPAVRAACVRALGAAGNPVDLAAITARSNDSSPEVRVAVAAAMSRIGDDIVRARVVSEIVRLSRAPSPTDRVIAAEMLEACEGGDCIDRTALGRLVRDRDDVVANAALAAMRWPGDSELLVEVVGRLRNRRTAGAAVDALVRGGDTVLVAVEDGLTDHRLGRRVQILLARVCRLTGGSLAIAVLRRHVEHPDRDVGLAVMAALGALVPTGTSPDRSGEPERSAVTGADLEHATHVLRAVLTFDGDPSATLMVAALRDELDLVRARVLAGLSTRYGAETVNKIAFQFAQRDSRSHALALEWLDVTLTGTDRAALALLEPGLSESERMLLLERWFPVVSTTPRAALLDLVLDGDDRWRRPWLRACALHAASGLSDPDLDVAIAAGDEDPTLVSHDDEVAILHETRAAIRRRRAVGQVERL